MTSLYRLVEKVVFSGVNGLALLPIFIWSIGVLINSAIETIKLFKEV